MGRRGKQRWPRKSRRQHDDGRTPRSPVSISVRFPDERGQLGRDAVAVDRDPGELAELPDDHGDGDPGQVADQDRLGQQVGDEPEPRDEGHQAQQADRRPPGRRPARRSGPGRRRPAARPPRPSSARWSTPGRSTAAATSRAARTPPAEPGSPTARPPAAARPARRRPSPAARGRRPRSARRAGRPAATTAGSRAASPPRAAAAPASLGCPCQILARRRATASGRPAAWSGPDIQALRCAHASPPIRHRPAGRGQRGDRLAGAERPARGVGRDAAGGRDRAGRARLRAAGAAAQAQRRPGRAGGAGAGQPDLPGLRPGDRVGAGADRLHAGAVHPDPGRGVRGRVRRHAARPAGLRDHLRRRPARRHHGVPGALRPADPAPAADRADQRLRGGHRRAVRVGRRPVGRRVGGAAPGGAGPPADRLHLRAGPVHVGAAQARGLPDGVAHASWAYRTRSSTIWSP